jgi:hypothetical protein
VRDPGLTGLAGKCPGLRHLSLANTEVTDAGLATIGEVNLARYSYRVEEKYR